MPSSQPLKLAVLAITYDKTEHASGLWKVFHHIWKAHEGIDAITLFHVYNGKPEWYPEKTGEDRLILRPNAGHIHGVADMLNAGMEEVLSSKEAFDFIVVCSSDAWITRPEKVIEILQEMKLYRQQLLTSRWFGWRTWASEWFAISPDLAREVFPLALTLRPEQKLFMQLGTAIHAVLPFFQIPMFEYRLSAELRSRLANKKKLVRSIPHRSFVWPLNRYFTREIGYISHHSLDKKHALLTPAVRQAVSKK